MGHPQKNNVPVLYFNRITTSSIMHANVLCFWPLWSLMFQLMLTLTQGLKCRDILVKNRQNITCWKGATRNVALKSCQSNFSFVFTFLLIYWWYSWFFTDFPDFLWIFRCHINISFIQNIYAQWNGLGAHAFHA